ncbi:MULTISPECIES: hypothetical protein [Mycolicibacterium]|uniref:Uncharacterized protein n=1 Tax=Mycolicibacterium neoaurum TaxID=1795 RepID=A0AAV2WEQ1_MYCNE|nr:hypothetical protein [Mycolicibacterium neoaurum]TLH62018.1 hypothetical protein C1S81_04870 [Mycolicibacterium neoaurum]CDQ42744.1 hypothetical protein BN1047_00601 [Mycolicibacterium neoaurum]
MNSALREQIQSICEVLHGDPHNAEAFDQLRTVLGIGDHHRVVTQDNWQRMVQKACDRLFDEPDNTDARDLLLVLLTAGTELTQ